MKLQWWNLVIVLIGVVRASPLEYVIISPDESTEPNKHNAFQIRTKKYQIKGHNAFLAIITGALKSSDDGTNERIRARSSLNNHFRVLVKDRNCALQKTSTFARHDDCIYAVNGGPFKSYINGECVGLTISNGTIINGDDDQETNRESIVHPCSASKTRDLGVGKEEEDEYLSNMNEEYNLPDSDVAFGVTKDNKWIIGNLQNYNHSNIQDLVTGLNGWLVYNSTVMVATNAKPKSTSQYEFDHNVEREKDASAPRTAIGVDAKGNKLVLLQVDGCEHCMNPFSKTNGLTMYEMANSIQEFADYAINLDGGGSSTSFDHGKVLNRPTCLDYVNVWCERPVASVVCILGPES